MTADATPTDGWSLPRRFAFRFCFAYWLLYSFPSPFSDLPFLEDLRVLTLRAWDAPVRWVASRLLHLPGRLVLPNGSGDTTFNYVQVLLMVVLALVTALLWSALQRGRRNHGRLAEGLRVYLRLVLSVSMLSYGFSKVMKTQFPFPPVDWLDQTLGNSSPMRLAWAFMGYSTAYNVFTGGAEVLGGVLLFFRRTTTLGALVLLGVMSNIVMLNFCYDVPVKLYSCHLFLMALWLAWPDLRRLADTLIFHRPTQGRSFAPRFERPWLRRTAALAKGALLLWVAGSDLHSRAEMRRKQEQARAQVPIAGLYEVETFARDGVELPPLMTQAERWQKVGIYAYGAFLYRTMTNERMGYNTTFDMAQGLLTFPHGGKDHASTQLRFTCLDGDHLALEGSVEGHDLKVRLRRIDLAKLPLVSRGFRWINEFPNNT